MTLPFSSKCIMYVPSINPETSTSNFNWSLLYFLLRMIRPSRLNIFNSPTLPFSLFTVILSLTGLGYKMMFAVNASSSLLDGVDLVLIPVQKPGFLPSS